MARSKFRTDLFALGAYFLLTLVLTYPLILHFTTHVAGDGSDDPALAWNLWWVRYALLDAGQNPIYTNAMFFPIGLNLGFYTLTYLNAFLSIPLQFTFGLVPAANINLILSFTLSGFGAYLLVKYLLNTSLRAHSVFERPKQSPVSPEEITSGLLVKQKPFDQQTLAMTIPFAAFVAGLLYAFSANKFLYASLGQFNIASSQWIPFYILFLLKIFNTPKPPLRYGFFLGFFLLAQALSEFIFASFLILFTFAYVIYWLIKTRLKISNLQSLISSLVLAALVFVACMSPILAAMFSDLLAEGDFIQQGLGFSNSFSADVLGFFIPSHLHPLFGGLEAQFHFAYINFMYLGFTAMVLALIALWKVKPARMWGIWFAIIALVTLGPTLRINGSEIDLPLPFDVLLDIPLIKGNRYPSRWGVVLTLCLAILVGYGVWYVANRVWQMADGRWQIAKSKQKFAIRGLLSVVALLLVFEHLSLPLPLSDFRVPEIYSQIAHDTGIFSVMEIPLAWRNGFRVTGSYRQDSQTLPDRIFMLAQFYQTTQQHPILNGNTSRNPELKFQYFSETPVLNSLIAIQEGYDIDDATRARDQELAPRLLQFFGTRYVIWHTPVEPENRDVANKTRAYIEQTLPVTKISETYENGRGVVAYRVNSLPTTDSLSLEPNDPLARLYLGEGWGAIGDNEFWAQRREAKLFFPLATPQNFKLTLNGFMPYPATGQGLAVSVNGTRVAYDNPIPLSNRAYSVKLAAGVLKSGMNEITFTFDRTLPSDQVLGSPPSIVIRSAGEEQGAFGHIYVNGQEKSPNARGYNIVVINLENGGLVEESMNFDTFDSEQESERMVQFIAQIPEGRVVAVAASDEASQHLTSNAVKALQSLGAKQDLRGKFRWSHALLAIKGTTTAVAEAASATQVSQIIQGDAVTEPTISASIGEIRIEPAP